MKSPVKEIYSPSKKHRVTIFKRDTKQYILETSSFYIEENVWEDTTCGMQLYESQNLAEEGAKEMLRNMSGEFIE